MARSRFWNVLCNVNRSIPVISCTVELLPEKSEKAEPFTGKGVCQETQQCTWCEDWTLVANLDRYVTVACVKMKVHASPVVDGT